MSTENVKQIRVKKLPLILNKNLLLAAGNKPVKNNITIVKKIKNTIQEDVIYNSQDGDFTGENRNMTIVNRLNTVTGASKTVAKCQSLTGETYEKTSDDITKLIGQKNYNILFSSLCSLISQELKIRSISSLLTVPKSTKSVSCQTEDSDQKLAYRNSLVDTVTQTFETSFDYFKKIQPRKRQKRQTLAPYVVKDLPEVKKSRRVVINPDDFGKVFVKDEVTENTVTVTESQTDTQLPELHSVFDDEDSKDSIGRFSSLSVSTTPDLLLNPLRMICTNIDKHIRDSIVTNNDSPQQQNMATEIYKSYEPMHPSLMNRLPVSVASKSAENVPKEQRIKFLIQQAVNDLKYCSIPDGNGHLPIHVALLSNDVDLLKRQCLALKKRMNHVDIPADGLTPLKMSLFQDNVELMSILLQHGADILETDDEDRSLFHQAAEMNTDHLHVLVNYCRQNARKILQDNEEHWKPGYESKSDEVLAQILLAHINKSYDSQGYTPLMLASKLGKYSNVAVLVESCAGIVNVKMPSSGNTALYLAVGAACMDAEERGNKSKIVDHFAKTVEILVENGADPNIANFSGSSVNELLTEINIGELSMIIANKLTSIRFFDNQLPTDTKSTDYMLIKDGEGNMNIKDIKKKTNKKNSPIIIENIAYKPVKPLITLPVQSSNSPGSSKEVNVSQSYTPIIKKFQLNTPLILKSDIQNNKRKLDIVVQPNKIKKANKND